MGKGSLKDKLNRRDCLLALLRSESFWTASQLCKELQVSLRTLMRDISELREQGYPIEADKGRGGGVRLVERWGIDKLHLSNYEVLEMLLSMAIAESLHLPVLSGHLKSIRKKISLSFPSHQRKIINSLRKRILVGDQASLEVKSSYKEKSVKNIDGILESFFQLKKVKIKYQSEKKEVTKRIIEAHFILLNWPAWYILAWDHLRQDIRFFRLDRISMVKVLDERFKLREHERFLREFEEYFKAI